MYKDNHNEIVDRINREIDKCNMAYKVKDRDGNTFVFAGIENGHPVYRCQGGSKHIFDLIGLEIVQKYMD